MSKVIFVYITAKNKSEAKRIGISLVKENLCACVNIFPQMESIYKWENKINRHKEVVLIAKTVKTKFSKLSKRVKELHSYACPCIVAIPIADGNSEYVKWLQGKQR